MSNVKLLAARTPLYGPPDCDIGVPHVALEGILGVVSHKTVIIGFFRRAVRDLKSAVSGSLFPERTRFTYVLFTPDSD